MDKDEIWNKTLVLLLEDTDEEDPKTVFLNLLTPVGVFGDQFVLLAESTPVESWVRKNYLTEIQDKLLQVMGTPVSVGLGVSTQKEAPQQTTPAPVETVQPVSYTHLDVYKRQSHQYIDVCSKSSLVRASSQSCYLLRYFFHLPSP